MSDNTQDTNTPESAVSDEQKQEQQFLIQRVYLKDLSFESPMAPKVFLAKLQPKINQELATETKKVDEDIYEVVLKLTIKANVESDVAFLVEIQQAGLFYIKGIDSANMNRIFNTVCPQLLFPYAREAIDAVLVKGSFPALMLPPVNFEAIFAQAVAKKNEQDH